MMKNIIQIQILIIIKKLFIKIKLKKIIKRRKDLILETLIKMYNIVHLMGNQISKSINLLKIKMKKKKKSKKKRMIALMIILVIILI